MVFNHPEKVRHPSWRGQRIGFYLMRWYSPQRKDCRLARKGSSLRHWPCSRGRYERSRDGAATAVPKEPADGIGVAPASRKELLVKRPQELPAADAAAMARRWRPAAPEELPRADTAAGPAGSGRHLRMGLLEESPQELPAADAATGSAGGGQRRQQRRQELLRSRRRLMRRCDTDNSSPRCRDVLRCG